MQKSKLRLLHRIFSILFVLAGLAFSAFLVLMVKDRFVHYIEVAWKYTIDFLPSRKWDTKTYIVVGLLALIVIVEPFWLFINIHKKKGVFSYFCPVALPVLVFTGLAMFKWRDRIEAIYNGNNAIYAYGLLASAILLVVLFLANSALGLIREKDDRHRVSIDLEKDIVPEKINRYIEVDHLDDDAPVAEEAPKVAEDPVVEVSPVVEPVEEEVVEVAPPKVESKVAKKVTDKSKYGEIIRRTFVEKLGKDSSSIKDAYNEIKSELLSYDVKARVSKTGESFRHKKVLLAKITAQGKIIKINLALNPKAYSNTTMPVQDIGMKKSYIEIPALLKIKSGLSVKRAKMLITDLMQQKGLPQGEVVKKNHAKKLKEVKA